ncbi:hypothetical protein ABT56_18470 [Photobacterium aquae]|uniref:Uncharacterized protein n=1 Tax=Photobacterium aquae TaxID=1195763 RepID=A0A0J1GVC9_9GAMM|nr:hypothetical protein [Photobacterium aquae]KLV03586.1 hypothetical protein ABT56_18470 [Photobacterium aquae]
MIQAYIFVFKTLLCLTILGIAAFALGNIAGQWLYGNTVELTALHVLAIIIALPTIKPFIRLFEKQTNHPPINPIVQ